MQSSLLLPLAASATVVFGAPYVGQLRGTLQSTFPEQYRAIVGGTIAIAVILAIASAVTRIRRRQKDPVATDTDRRHRAPVRYALIASALLIAAAYAASVRTGNPDVDLVEGFHFVEYGLVTWLYYRVWRYRASVAALIFPASAALLVAIADESMQWFVPGRVGEMHDVWLDAAAIGCGLLFSAAIHPPASLAWPRHRRARVAVGAALSCVILAFAVFVDRVHLGYQIAEDGVGTFRSQYDARTLDQASVDRATRWQTAPPPLFWFAREDRYLSEGLWHIQERNLAESAGNFRIAWNENRILERFYAPVLDNPHAVGGPGSARWSAEQRSRMTQIADAERHLPFVSDAAPYPIYSIGPSMLWLPTLFLVTVVMVASVRVARSDASSAHEALSPRS